MEIIQATLGGSFGGKDEVMTSMCCRAALLALATGKPVKMVNTREESMLESYKRHPYVLYYKWGAKQDGSITAMEIRCIADGGAYASMSPFVTWRSVVQATGPYYCEHVKTDVYAVYTNNNYTGAMRGFGSPQVNFAIESMMDELAEKVGKDPLEIRLQNGFKDGAVTATQQRLTHKVSLCEVLTKAADAAGFPAKWQEVSRDAPDSARKKRGIGLACSYRGVSLGAEGVDAAGAIVSVQTDGSVIVSSGITDMGQGAQTQMSQIAAEVLGISMDRVRFLNTNTSRVPDSGPTVASRGTIMGGSAAKKAAEIVRATLLEVGAEMVKVPRTSASWRTITWSRQRTGKRLASFHRAGGRVLPPRQADVWPRLAQGAAHLVARGGGQGRGLLHVRLRGERGRGGGGHRDRQGGRAGLRVLPRRRARRSTATPSWASSTAAWRWASATACSRSSTTRTRCPSSSTSTNT